MCRLGGIAALGLVLALGGCRVIGGGGEQVTLRQVMIAGDEPIAVRTARAVLDDGGNAVDAAVAAGFALAVTLPSRTGLGAGGACLVHDAEADTVSGVAFGAAAGGGTAGGPAPPGLARGLFALHALGGRLRWEALVRRAEMLARFGVEVPRILADDIAAADAVGRLPDAWRGDDGAPVAEGTVTVRPELAASLAEIRVAGGTALDRGALAARFAEGAAAVGHPIDPADLRDAPVAVFEPEGLPVGRDMLYLADPPAAAGPQQRRRWQAVEDADGAPADALARAALAAPADPAPGTALAVLWGQSSAVVCGFGLGGLFGTGAVAEGTGIVVGRRPDGDRPLVAGLALQVNHPTDSPALMIAASDAAAALSGPLAAALLANAPAAQAAGAPRVDARAAGRLLAEPDVPRSALPPGPVDGAASLGRANVVHCPRDRTSAGSGPTNCRAEHDPRGPGLSVSRILLN